MPEHSPVPTPNRAIYGFAMYLTFTLFSIIFMIVAIIPNEWFRDIGITCLPNRYWYITIPIFCLTALAIFGFIIYPSCSLLITPDVHDLTTIQDNYSKRTDTNLNNCDEMNGISECICFDKRKCSRELFISNLNQYGQKSIPVLNDLDISKVSDLLYLK